MGGIRLPRPGPNPFRRVKTATEDPQIRVKSLLRHIDPVQKEVVQRKLFVEQYMEGMDNTDILKNIDIDPVLRRQLEAIYQQPVRKINYRGQQRATNFVSENLNFAIKKIRHIEIKKSHQFFIKKSSVMILIQDKSHTTTNKMYHNTIVNKIKALENQADTIKSKNMDANTLATLLSKNDNLVQELTLLQPVQNEPEPLLKSICIPPHAIELTEKIFDIVHAQAPLFDIVSVIFNLKTSSRLNLELKQAFEDGNVDMPKEINYESLLQMAQKSHEKKNGIATGILKKIGEASFLDVNVTENIISLTKRK